tara:strand:- start:172 stop:1293 length:1122 start_codon:yes stop_codon:yes gene_type:complete
MPALLKHIYNDAFFREFTNALGHSLNGFDKKAFLAAIYGSEWENKELKQRMRHISNVLSSHLPGPYPQQLEALLKTIRFLKEHGRPNGGLEHMVFPDFLEAYGQQHFKITVAAFEEVTQFISCEFAVRPFLLMDLDKMMAQMNAWSTHAHPMVRRLATEGCRPRLPWAMAIPALKKDPAPIFPILERLKNDPSESVRRSVANNLNDISKDHPQRLIHLARQWRPRTKATDQLLKHACRTLLKQGDPEVLQLFGFEALAELKISRFQVHTPEVVEGGLLEFSFDLINDAETDLLVRLEYGIHYQKANGSLSRKVFKISERIFPERSTTPVRRKQSFRPITTRRFHAGLHQVSVIVNGQEMARADFQLQLARAGQ